VAGAVRGGELLPGLPVSALAAVCPAAAAAILIYRNSRAAGVAAFLKRSTDFNRIANPLWYVPILLLVPALYAVAYRLMVFDRPMPEPAFDLRAIPAVAAAFFVAGVTEELGWSGYALDPMQHRWGPLRAALLLGAFWAVWHWIPLVQAGHETAWIAWWSIGTVSLRVLHVWIYNHTGQSVFGQALFHASSNLAWQLFPNASSHYDPAITAPILFITAAIVIGAGWLRGSNNDLLGGR
jgi:membrane protease YdiL (CAAX protease family)